MFSDPRGKATVNGFVLDDPPDAVRDECLTTRARSISSALSPSSAPGLFSPVAPVVISKSKGDFSFLASTNDSEFR